MSASFSFDGAQAADEWKQGAAATAVGTGEPARLVVCPGAEECSWPRKRALLVRAMQQQQQPQPSQGLLFYCEIGALMG